MKPLKNYPEARGTRSGYVIRYTCPSCTGESVIVSSSAQDHYKQTRNVTCGHCRVRVTVLTPGRI